MKFIDTLKGSFYEKIMPEGWDFEKMDACCDQSRNPESIYVREGFWDEGFEPVGCATLEDFNIKMGYELAYRIRKSRESGELLALIIPVGPLGMYRWAIYFLTQWKVSCDHVWGFNMDEWSDASGNTFPASHPYSFEYCMRKTFYEPLKDLTVPENQRNFATKENLPTYAGKIAALREKGAKLITVYGIGRMMHIAFWEPHFAADYADDAEWRKSEYRIAGNLHPLTIEQCALLCFKGRTPLMTCWGNTIGPGLFLSSDYAIGGADGIFGRGMQWQGLSLWVTLKHGPSMWIPSSFMPTLPGKLFFVDDLKETLDVEYN